MDFPTDSPLSPSWLTIPASIIYRFLAEFHHGRFDRNPGRIDRASVPAISVGNLTVGGTGKTPCVVSLVAIIQAILRRHGISGSPAILTRGYGRRGKDLRRLGPDSTTTVAWREVGDEPMMLHWLLPDIPIVIHQDRREGAKAAVREYGSPALIMDDGFQYRALRKDLEIVLVDGEKPLGNGYLLPAGSLREPASALRRADILVGVGSATTEMEAARRLAGEYDRAFCEAFVRSGKPVKFPKDNSSTAPKKVVLVSGIARHERFYRAAVEAGFQPCEHCHFRDHHPFSQKDMIHVQDIVRRVGAEAILTTAKDAVRLADLRVELPIWILPVEFCWKKPEEIASLIEKMLFAGGSDDPPRQG